MVPESVAFHPVECVVMRFRPMEHHMNKRRTHRAWRKKLPQPVGDCVVSASQAPTLAGVLKDGEPDTKAAPIAPRQAEKPLLKTWPAGYEKGSFRLLPGGVLLSAEGMPVLRIEEGGQ